MKESGQPKNDWVQFAEDVAACGCMFVRALIPDPGTRRELKRHALRAQAGILRGLLGLVEGELARTETPPKPRGEKIRVS